MLYRHTSECFLCLGDCCTYKAVGLHSEKLGSSWLEFNGFHVLRSMVKWFISAVATIKLHGCKSLP